MGCPQVSLAGYVPVTNHRLGVSAFQPVKEPVHLSGPSTTVRLVELSLEIVQCVAFLLTVHFQRVSDVTDVIKRLQFGDAARQHHCQKSDEDVGVLPQRQVSLTAQLHKPDTADRQLCHTREIIE